MTSMLWNGQSSVLLLLQSLLLFISVDNSSILPSDQAKSPGALLRTSFSHIPNPVDLSLHNISRVSHFSPPPLLPATFIFAWIPATASQRVSLFLLLNSALPQSSLNTAVRMMLLKSTPDVSPLWSQLHFTQGQSMCSWSGHISWLLLSSPFNSSHSGLPDVSLNI